MDSKLQNKLWNYEAPPPDGLWASLSAALDEGFAPTLGQKLESYQAPPPAGAWGKISRQLDEPKESATPVVPFFRRYRMPLKYTGTIAIIAFLAILAALTISKKTISETAGVPVVIPAAKTAPSSIHLHPGVVTNDAAIASIAAHKRVSLQPAAFRKTEQVSPLPFATTRSSFALFTPPAADYSSMMPDDGRADNYMVYTDEDGHAMRLPKKMFDAVACPTQTTACRERLKRMQEKIAAAALNPDFSGVLDLLNHISENQ